MKIAKSNGLEISESSRHENMRKHIDYWVWKPNDKDKKWSVDVKSRKRTNRKRNFRNKSRFRPIRQSTRENWMY